MSLISDELFNHTLDLSLKRTEDTEFIFQKRQPVLVYKDNELDGQFFVESSERTSENVYDIQCHNYTGILESNKFYGGIYFNVSAEDIIDEIFAGEQIKVNMPQWITILNPSNNINAEYLYYAFSRLQESLYFRELEVLYR